MEITKLKTLLKEVIDLTSRPINDLLKRLTDNIGLVNRPARFEKLVTIPTLKRLFICVDKFVRLQTSNLSKPFVAYRTNVWLFLGMNSHMGFQML